jgi:HPt (histidine-containing phosphotransfer) domain-containing protein
VIRQEESENTSEPERRIAILALTANAMLGQETLVQALGVDGFLTKPLRLERLRSALQELLPQLAPIEPQSGTNTSSNKLSDVFNLSVLTDLVGDDPAILVDFLQLFRRTAVSTVEEIDSAWQTQHLPGLAHIAHRFKSSARSVGAILLADLCASLERHASEEDANGCASLLPQIHVAVEHVNAEITNYIESTGLDSIEA